MTIYANAPNNWVANDIPFDQAQGNQELREKFLEIDNAFGLSALRADNLNLQIAMGGTPDEQVDVDAESLTLFNATFESKSISNINLTIDNTGAGANGIDTGVVAINELYYIWVIAKVDGTVAGLFSLSRTIGTITLPAGYLYARLIGAIFTDGSSDFIPGTWSGDWFIYDAPVASFTGNGNTSFVDLDISPVMPEAITRRCNVNARTNGSGRFIGIRKNGTTAVMVSGVTTEYGASGIVETDVNGIIEHEVDAADRSFSIYVNAYENVIRTIP